MTGDMSSRSEWYESDYDPSPFEHRFRINTLQWARRMGKSQLSVQIVIDAKPFVQALASVGTRLHAAMIQTGYIEARPPVDESARDRALRLAKQPHSFAQDPHDFHFDNRGRRRY